MFDLQHASSTGSPTHYPEVIGGVMESDTVAQMYALVTALTEPDERARAELVPWADESRLVLAEVLRDPGRADLIMDDLLAGRAPSYDRMDWLIAELRDILNACVSLAMAEI